MNEQAAEYYELCEPGLGQEFVLAVDEAIAFILEFPQASPIVAETPAIRKRLLRKFPASICYAIDGNVALILAVAHSKRQSGYWLSR